MAKKQIHGPRHQDIETTVSMVGDDLAHVGQCTAQYSTVQHSTAANCSQSVRGGASVNISTASPQISSLYCNTVIYSDLDNVKKVKGDVIS